MSSAAQVPDPGRNRAGGMTRRGFLGATSVAGSAALAVPWRPAASPLSQQQRAMVLQVARVVAVFPIRFPSIMKAVPATPRAASERASAPLVARAFADFPARFPGFAETAPAAARATMPRLTAATRRLSTSQLALVRAGTDDLIASGLLDQDAARLLAGIGRQAASGTPAGQARLAAVAVLAITTLASPLSASSGNLAQTWTGVIRRMHQKGVLGHVAGLRGIG